MNNKEAIAWADKKRKTEKSDGCTVSPDFNFRECCERHDMMRRFNVGISKKQSDDILRDCIAKKGHPVKARIYWAAVRLSAMLGGMYNLIALIVIIATILGLSLL